MIKLLRIPLVLITLLSVFAFQVRKTEQNNLGNIFATTGATAKQAAAALWFKWDYVMDWRYGRTCSPGGGICFHNEDGEYFDYWNYSVAPGDVPGDDAADTEVGPMYLRIEGDQLHVVFCRSVEGNTFMVDNDVRLRDELQNSLGRKFTIRKGEYRVDYNRYKDYGEAWLNIY